MPTKPGATEAGILGLLRNAPASQGKNLKSSLSAARMDADRTKNPRLQILGAPPETLSKLSDEQGKGTRLRDPLALVATVSLARGMSPQVPSLRARGKQASTSTSSTKKGRANQPVLVSIFQRLSGERPLDIGIDNERSSPPPNMPHTHPGLNPTSRNPPTRTQLDPWTGMDVPSGTWDCARYTRRPSCCSEQQRRPIRPRGRLRHIGAEAKFGVL